MAAVNTIPASVQPKKGRLYAVIQTKKTGKANQSGVRWDCRREATGPK